MNLPLPPTHVIVPKSLIAMHDSMLNVRAKVENEMWSCVNGKAPLPDKEKLRQWALQLGVPAEANPQPYIFVFGSNLVGNHGKGAAAHAVEHHGAIHGCPEGLQGSSYAIPTKDSELKTLPRFLVQRGIDRFFEFARSRPDLRFVLTPVGTGYTGYTVSSVLAMIRSAQSALTPIPTNILLTSTWLGKH